MKENPHSEEGTKCSKLYPAYRPGLTLKEGTWAPAHPPPSFLSENSRAVGRSFPIVGPHVLPLSAPTCLPIGTNRPYYRNNCSVVGDNYLSRKNNYRNAWCRFYFFESIKTVKFVIQCGFKFFELIKTVMEKFSRGTFF